MNGNIAIIVTDNCLDCGQYTPFPDDMPPNYKRFRHTKENGRDILELAWFCNKTKKIICWQKQGNDYPPLTHISVPDDCPHLKR